MRASSAVYIFANIALAIASSAAFAQSGAPPTTIESYGSASTEVPPDIAEFKFVHRATGETVAKAMATAVPFEGALRAEVDKRNIPAHKVSVAGPAIVTLNPPTAEVSAIIQVALAPIRTSKTAAADFAAICDRMIQLSTDMHCTLDGPNMFATEPKAVESVVIGAAVEDAYSGGDGVAHVMQAGIATVENVRIVDVKWKDRSAEPGSKPDLKRIVCTAKVAVKYTASQVQP